MYWYTIYTELIKYAQVGWLCFFSSTSSCRCYVPLLFQSLSKHNAPQIHVYSIILLPFYNIALVFEYSNILSISMVGVGVPDEIYYTWPYGIFCVSRYDPFSSPPDMPVSIHLVPRAKRLAYITILEICIVYIMWRCLHYGLEWKCNADATLLWNR